MEPSNQELLLDANHVHGDRTPTDSPHEENVSVVLEDLWRGCHEFMVPSKEMG